MALVPNQDLTKSQQFDIALMNSNAHIVGRTVIPDLNKEVIVFETSDEPEARGLQTAAKDLLGMDAQMNFFPKHNAWRIYGLLPM